MNQTNTDYKDLKSLEEISEEEPIRVTSSGRVLPPPPVDINPREWLDSDDSAIIGYVQTRIGRLKIAALTEEESDTIRKGSERPINPGKTNSGKKIDLKRLRVLTVAASLNKAYKDQGIVISPDEVQRKLTGEVTSIVQKISELSGYKEEEDDAESVTGFLPAF